MVDLVKEEEERELGQKQENRRVTHADTRHNVTAME